LNEVGVDPRAICGRLWKSKVAVPGKRFVSHWAGLGVVEEYFELRCRRRLGHEGMILAVPIRTFTTGIPRECYADFMDIVLTPVEARVLGALIEKDITTTDYYPLSLNALVNACNQKNNRDPAMRLDENAVRDALSGLQQFNLAGPARGADSRVTKYEHRSQEAFNFSRGETAVLCVLLLRGPQTPGELRGRTERMHQFEDLDAVQASLQKLMQRDPPLVTMLTRQPGTKESRYAHLLSGDVEAAELASQNAMSAVHATDSNDRVERLEEQVATLREEVRVLKEVFEGFRKQSE
jgi:hypothetical protein